MKLLVACVMCFGLATAAQQAIAAPKAAAPIVANCEARYQECKANCEFKLKKCKNTGTAFPRFPKLGHTTA